MNLKANTSSFKYYYRKNDKHKQRNSTHKYIHIIQTEGFQNYI